MTKIKLFQKWTDKFGKSGEHEFEIVIVKDTGKDYQYRIVNLTDGSIWRESFFTEEDAINYIKSTNFKILSIENN